MDFTTLVQNMGFPIATAIALGWYVYQITKQTREDFLSRENRILEANDKLATALNKSSEAITEATNNYENIFIKLERMETKVDKLHSRFDEVKKITIDE